MQIIFINLYSINVFIKNILKYPVYWKRFWETLRYPVSDIFVPDWRVSDRESLISRWLLFVVGAESPLRRRVHSVVSMPIISRSDGRSVSDYWIGYRGRKKKLGNRCCRGYERNEMDVLRRKKPHWGTELVMPVASGSMKGHRNCASVSR